MAVLRGTSILIYCGRRIRDMRGPEPASVVTETRDPKAVTAPLSNSMICPVPLQLVSRWQDEAGVCHAMIWTCLGSPVIRSLSSSQQIGALGGTITTCSRQHVGDTAVMPK